MIRRTGVSVSKLPTGPLRRALERAGATWGLLVLGACGASQTPPATHAHFHAIQRHEATMDQAAAAASGGECDDACPAIGEACQASSRICDIADSVEDADADARCEAARRRCAQLEARPDCECP